MAVNRDGAGLSLGYKLFYNEEHERRIAEIQRQK